MLKIAESFRLTMQELVKTGALADTVNKWGTRAAIGGAVALPIAAASYGLGRGLRHGELDKEKKQREEAIRSARLSGTPSPY